MNSKVRNFFYNIIHYLRQRDPIHEAAFFIPIIYFLIFSKVSYDLIQDPFLIKTSYFYNFVANFFLYGSMLVSGICSLLLALSWARPHPITYYFRGFLIAFICNKLLKEFNIFYLDFVKLAYIIFPFSYFLGGLVGDNLKLIYYEISLIELKARVMEITNKFEILSKAMIQPTILLELSLKQRIAYGLLVLIIYSLIYRCTEFLINYVSNVL